jgi:hypothetical protein
MYNKYTLLLLALLSMCASCSSSQMQTVTKQRMVYGRLIEECIDNETGEEFERTFDGHTYVEAREIKVKSPPAGATVAQGIVLNGERSYRSCSMCNLIVQSVVTRVELPYLIGTSSMWHWLVDHCQRGDAVLLGARVAAEHSERVAMQCVQTVKAIYGELFRAYYYERERITDVCANALKGCEPLDADLEAFDERQTLFAGATVR